MKKKPDFRKIWIFLFFLVGVLFLLLGIAEIFADKSYLFGSAKIIFSLTLFTAAFMIIKNRLEIEYSSVKMIALVNTGFLFMIIGGTGARSISIAVLGYILLLAGILIPSGEKKVE